LYKKYSIKHDLGVIMFDYLKEPDSSSVDRQRSEYQLLGDVTTTIKNLAGELDIPAVTAVQLNRAKEIADSDKIARYADVIALWSTRDKKEIEDHGLEAGGYKLVVQNTRRGGQTPTIGIGYNFFKEQLRIKEVEAPKQAIDFSRIINEGSAYHDEEPL
jgi:replicative DNA helicase